MAFFGIDQSSPGRYQPALDQLGERNARRVARGHEWRKRGCLQRLDRGDALLGGLGITGFALEADEAAAEMFRHRAGGAGAAKRIEYQVVDPRTGKDHARE